MAKQLTPKEFYRALSKRSGVKEEKVQDLWEAFQEFLVEELFRNGDCYLPNIGLFKLNEYGGRNGHVPDKNGGIKNIYIEPYLCCTFRATEVFQQILNNGRKPRAELKRDRERYRTEIESEKSKERVKELLVKLFGM